MAFSRLLPVLLLVSTAIAHPTPADDPAPDSARIQTSFTHVGCSQEQIDILNQNVNDAVALAAAGLDYINDELVTKSYPQYGHRQVDFSKQAAIDFFGPESKNAPYQQHIFGKLRIATKHSYDSRRKHINICNHASQYLLQNHYDLIL